MAKRSARMPLSDHFGELRVRLIRIVVTLVACILIFYAAAPMIGQFLLLPIKDFLPQDDNGMQLFALTPFESFGTRFKIAFWSSVVAGSPLIL